MSKADDNIRLQVNQIFNDLLYSVTQVKDILPDQKESLTKLSLETAYFESFMTDNKKVKCKACGYNGRLAWLGNKDSLIGCARCGSKNWEISLTTT
jgi:hypothetical protein